MTNIITTERRFATIENSIVLSSMFVSFVYITLSMALYNVNLVA